MTEPHRDADGRPMYYSQRGCDCEYCVAERQRVRDCRAYRRRIEQGSSDPYPSAEQRVAAQAKIRRMNEAGRSCQTIALLLGYSAQQRGGNSAIVHLLASDMAAYRMTWKRYHRIMALDETSAPLGMNDSRRCGRYVRPIGVVRRLQALYAMGYSFAWMGEQIGGTKHLGIFAADPSKKITVQMADDITKLYAKYENGRVEETTPAVRIRLRAVKLGYAPPAAWDDIDNPEAFPQWTGRCGEAAGAQQHRRAGTRLCDPCRRAELDAQAARRRERNGGVKRPQGRPKSPCGTHAAYVRHCDEGTEPCRACRDANNAYKASRKKELQGA